MMPMSSTTYATMPAAGYGAPVTYMTQPQSMMYAAPPVVQAPPVQYVNEHGQPCDEHGQPLQYVNEHGQPCDENGQPLQYVNEHGQPCDENGQPLQYVNEHGQPCDANGNLLMQPGASMAAEQAAPIMSYGAPAQSQQYMQPQQSQQYMQPQQTQQHMQQQPAAGGVGGVFSCPPELFMKMSQGQQLTPAETDIVMGRASAAPAASMAPAYSQAAPVASMAGVYSQAAYAQPTQQASTFVSLPAPPVAAPASAPAPAPVGAAVAKDKKSSKKASKKSITSKDKKQKKGCC